MPHFSGQMIAGCGSVTRLSHNDLTADVSAWTIGVYVKCFINEQGIEVIKVYRIGGKSNPKDKVLIAELTNQ